MTKDGDCKDYVDNCLNTNTIRATTTLTRREMLVTNDDDNDGLHDVLDDCRYGYTN